MHTAPGKADSPVDLQAYLPTDPGAGWAGPRGEPPPAVHQDPLVRWDLVRSAMRAADRLGLPVDQVRRIERRLRPDRQMRSIHGEFDALTIIAIQWYQHDHGLPMSGIPDEATLLALAAEWPELRRTSVRRLLPSRVIVPGSASTLQRFLRYRRAILDLGGLVDDGHRQVNVLLLRQTELTVGTDGLILRSVDAGRRSYVTVSLWVERARGRDNADVIGVTARERPGLVHPVQLSGERRIPTLEGGQYVCDLDRDGPPVREARALVPRYPTDPLALPVNPPLLPRDEESGDARARALVDTQLMTWNRFYAELYASYRERVAWGQWTGFRLTVLDGSRLGSGPLDAR